MDVKQEKRIDDYWNIDGSRDLSDPWAAIGRNLPTDKFGPVREINKRTAFIHARSSMARTPEVNGKARQVEGEAKVV